MNDLQDFLSLLLDDTAEPNLQLPSPELLQIFQDLKNRVIWIDAEIDESMLGIVPKIIQWNREDRTLPPAQRTPIKIFFNSPGGNLDIAEILVSIIKLSQTPIYGFAFGMVASAASLIYLSCHKRFALPNAYLIIHQGSARMDGNYDQMVAAMKDYEEQIERMTKFYIENTDYTENEIRTNIKTDWYVRGEELLERKLITNWVSTIDELL